MNTFGANALAAQPPRVLGSIDATCVVVGAIVGVGIFFTPSKVAGLCQSGTLALLAWTVGGVIALCGALVFAELGSRYHGSAAHYQILRDSYGPLVGFVFVFCNATAIIAGSMGIIAIICAQNLLALVGQTEPPWRTVAAISIVLILGLMIANLLGAKWGARIQNLTVYAKICTLLAIIALAMALGPRGPQIAGQPVAEQVPRQLSAFAAITAALVSTLFAYGGWQQALWITGEIRDPARNVSRAIIGGVVIVVSAYLLVNWAYLHLLGVEGVARSETLAADAVGAAAPGLGRQIAAAAVALSAFGVLNAQLLTGPRLIFGLARDGRFFRPFGLLSARFGTPVPAITLMSLFAVILVVSAGEKRIDRLLTGVVFIDGIFFALTGLALLVLRVKERRARALRAPHTITDQVHRDRHDPPSGAPVPRKLPLAWIVLPVFVVGEVGVVIGAYLDPETRRAAYIGAAWLALAIVLYLALFRRQENSAS